jgi:hypothetical protein
MGNTKTEQMEMGLHMVISAETRPTEYSDRKRGDTGRLLDNLLIDGFSKEVTSWVENSLGLKGAHHAMAQECLEASRMWRMELDMFQDKGVRD